MPIWQTQYTMKFVKEYTYNMGAIQGSMNKALGSVAAAVAVGTKLAQKEAMNTEEGLLATEHFHEASADITKLTGEAEEAGKLVESTTKTYDELMAKKPGGKGNTKKSLEERRGKALSEKEAAQRAFDELKDRIEAKVAMKSRAEAIMKRTGRWGGMR